MSRNVENIKFIILDVDGTLTDGKLYYDNNGIETKSFSVKDGFAIVEARELGFKFGIITGRESKIVEKRAKELKFEIIYQGIKNKLEKIDEICNIYNIKYEEIAYMGDDINDIPAIKKVGFTAAPNDADNFIKEQVDFVSTKNGGDGAVREFIEHILKEKNLWKNIIEKYLNK
ncbi:3-deoxy-D-manno-octulosonate 8-phosphate phosphatase (KDO 8-P phosphatase) [Hypnocyclicus thermotrophus]|uniref:3-deoxy-D-manno-octulosonate 8-phosphate phosphatase (KDO 8-P phosphatase) n=1 Tax=Hypnocyclicus thermotrophus TaxID=1627895 RepID=A0AA46DY85_9FUSO|nr:HAD-IIIA family hydrolase [Hypnocyclicus thermotrophus]TDT69730.1 3-deoxy-D-manno-octulosonate 8-phosphate phosphatase (KDO 8-P phosphatase) [Hypnocyclicus thermotrophus]